MPTRTSPGDVMRSMVVSTGSVRSLVTGRDVLFVSNQQEVRATVRSHWWRPDRLF